MIGVIEKQWGGIPEIEAEILDGVDLDLKEAKNRPQVNAILKQVKKACEKKKREVSKLLKDNNFSKAEFREFNHELRKEIIRLVEEQDAMPLSEDDYLAAMSEVIFLFREISSLVGRYIDNDIIVRRESMAVSTLGAMI